MLRRVLFIMVLLALSLGSALSGEIAGGWSFKFGEKEVICIQDAANVFPAKLFGSKTSNATYQGSINVFLVRTKEKTILIDAGNDQTRGSLYDKLQLLKVSPESISDVLITHIHPDHVGGLLWNGRPLFPKANLHIAKQEYEAWEKDAGRSGLAKYLKPYEKNLQLFDYGQAGPLGLVPEKRGGHTPGHTIYRMALPGNTEAIFVGDIVHAASLQFPRPKICARYDAAPDEAIASRIQTLQMKGILFGAHIPFPGAAKGGLVKKGAPDWSFTFQKYQQ